MQYINPIEILGLSSVKETTSIDNEIVKKAKRKLFAEIDLSDNGLFEYYGIQLTKGDCEKVIEELTNNDLKEFYLYLLSNKKLNNFLVNGNDDVFTNFIQDSIFKLPDFLKFISPYFASKFDKALLKAIENEDVEKIKSILKANFLICQSDINIAYKSVSNNIQTRINEISEIKRGIEKEVSVYNEDNIGDVVDLVVKKFPSDVLNCLPSYFQSQILKIAKEINYLNVVIWNNFDNTQVCKDLLEHVLTLNIGGLDKQTFQKNYDIVRRKNQERIEHIKNQPIIQKWATVLLAIRKYIEEVENKTITGSLAYSKTINLFSVIELNNLSNIGNDIRVQIGNAIINLSASIWNQYSDIKNALNTMSLASQINLDFVTKEKIKKSLIELKRLENKYKNLLICSFCNINNPDKDSSFSLELYKESNREYSGRTSSVSYYTSKIEIPRCSNCKRKHNFEGLIFFIPFILLTVIYLINNKNCETNDLLIYGFFFSIFSCKVIEATYYSFLNIKSDSKFNIEKFELVEKEFKNGWTLNVPIAKIGATLLSSLFTSMNQSSNFIILKIVGIFYKTSNKNIKYIITSIIILLLLVMNIYLLNLKSTFCSNNSEIENIESLNTPIATIPNVEEYEQPIISEFKGNQLINGASPLDGCFGKGIYSGNATLTIKNGGNSDAIICLYSISDDRTIRNEYVQKNSSFTMSNIAQGEYKIRVFYGNDWNPELENSCGTKGNFETDVNFSEFDGTEYFEDSDRGFTNATITLYTVAGGNASSSAIDQSQFFRK